MESALPIGSKIPVRVDVPEDRMPGFGSFIKIIQTGDLIGRCVLHPAVVDMSSIPAKTGGPDGDANFGITFSSAKHFRCTDLFKQRTILVVTASWEIHFRWITWQSGLHRLDAEASVDRTYLVIRQKHVSQAFDVSTARIKSFE